MAPRPQFKLLALLVLAALVGPLHAGNSGSHFSSDAYVRGLDQDCKRVGEPPQGENCGGRGHLDRILQLIRDDKEYLMAMVETKTGTAEWQVKHRMRSDPLHRFLKLGSGPLRSCLDMIHDCQGLQQASHKKKVEVYHFFRTLLHIYVGAGVNPLGAFLELDAKDLYILEQADRSLSEIIGAAFRSRLGSEEDPFQRADLFAAGFESLVRDSWDSFDNLWMVYEGLVRDAQATQMKGGGGKALWGVEDMLLLREQAKATGKLMSIMESQAWLRKHKKEAKRRAAAAVPALLPDRRAEVERGKQYILKPVMPAGRFQPMPAPVVVARAAPEADAVLLSSAKVAQFADVWEKKYSRGGRPTHVTFVDRSTPVEYTNPYKAGRLSVWRVKSVNGLLKNLMEGTVYEPAEEIQVSEDKYLGYQTVIDAIYDDFPDVLQFYVGGFVRDLFHGIKSKDLDIAVDMDPWTLQVVATKRHWKSARNGSAVFPLLKWGVHLENQAEHITAIESIPAWLTLGATNAWRDYTLNALYYDPNPTCSPECLEGGCAASCTGPVRGSGGGVILDPTGFGVEDCQNKVIRVANLLPAVDASLEVNARRFTEWYRTGTGSRKLGRWFHMRLKDFNAEPISRGFVMNKLDELLSVDLSTGTSDVQGLLAQFTQQTLNSGLASSARYIKLAKLLKLFGQDLADTGMDTKLVDRFTAVLFMMEPTSYIELNRVKYLILERFLMPLGTTLVCKRSNYLVSYEYIVKPDGTFQVAQSEHSLIMQDPGATCTLRRDPVYERNKIIREVEFSEVGAQ